MVHEVVVVGGGIGGLTVAALLAARGVDVCLLERNSQPGGVVARVESFGYSFDPGAGIYPLWQPGEIHDRVFAELPVALPEVRPQAPAYVVRLPDQIDIPITANDDEFAAVLHTAFPECGDRAFAFYQNCSLASGELRSSLSRPSHRGAGTLNLFRSIFPRRSGAANSLNTNNQTVAKALEGTSERFRQFVDAQLLLLLQRSSDACSYSHAAAALTIPRMGAFSIQGGAPALADRLADSIQQSGGRVRLNASVLRLAYDSAGRAVGVDLLNGETVNATQAIVSNLTVWDTYGKLIGLNRTPSEIRKALNATRGRGAYLLYLGMNDDAADRLPSNQLLALDSGHEESGLVAESSQLMFTAAPGWDPRAPEGKRAVTVLSFTDVDEWFTFHETADELEEKDQSTLELVWRQLHRAMPELGYDIEVIDTSTPLDCYELTRRKLGMVGAPMTTPPAIFPLHGSTSLDNVFIIGDTTSRWNGIAGVSRSALELVDNLTR